MWASRRGSEEGPSRVRCALWLSGLVSAAGVPSRAQVIRVAEGDRELARAEVSNARGDGALPITLLVALGADVRAGPADVLVRLFGDTLRFRIGQIGFRVNGRMDALHAWPYLEDGVLFVAREFFTNWLPQRYPERLTYRDGVLRIAVGEDGVPQRMDSAVGTVHGRDTSRSEAVSQPVVARRVVVGPAPRRAPPATSPQPAGERGEIPDPPPASRPDPDDPLRAELLGFIDARVSGVFDSNIDHDPAPRRSYGTVARVGVGIQSALSRPFLVARYDFGLYRFARTEEWNRTTHDVSAELAPSLGPIRLRLGAALRIGSWTEDRQPANQVVLKPQIEIRPTPIHLINLYVLQSARRIDVGAVTQHDTFRLAGIGYYLWWHGGGVRVDGRYEVNESEYERSRYAGWTGYAWSRIPFWTWQRLTLEAAYNRRRYPRRFVDQVGTAVRRDRRWTSSLSLSRELPKSGWELGVTYTFERNRSNDPYAAYGAHRLESTVRRRW